MGNKKCQMDGVTFDSQLEANYYTSVIKPAELAGLINGVVIHPPYPITINGITVSRPKLDFSYGDVKTGKSFAVDVKGFDTDMSRLKRKMIEAQYGIMVHVIKAGEFWLPLSEEKHVRG